MQILMEVVSFESCNGKCLLRKKNLYPWLMLTSVIDGILCINMTHLVTIKGKAHTGLSDRL